MKTTVVLSLPLLAAANLLPRQTSTAATTTATRNNSPECSSAFESLVTDLPPNPTEISVWLSSLRASATDDCDWLRPTSTPASISSAYDVAFSRQDAWETANSDRIMSFVSMCSGFGNNRDEARSIFSSCGLKKLSATRTQAATTRTGGRWPEDTTTAGTAGATVTTTGTAGTTTGSGPQTTSGTPSPTGAAGRNFWAGGLAVGAAVAAGFWGLM